MKKNLISKLFEAFKSGEILKDGAEFYKITEFNITLHPDFVQQRQIVVAIAQTNETGEL
jgi:hypothetical protein